MNTESIKRLAEADKKAHDVIQKARKEKERLALLTTEKAQEYEEELLKKKEEEVKRYFQRANEELANLEQEVIERVKQTVEDIRSKDALSEKIAKEIAKAVVQ